MQKTFQPISPKISAYMQKKHAGEVAVSLNGKILAIAKSAFTAFRNAQKSRPDVDDQKFLISHIRHGIHI